MFLSNCTIKHSILRNSPKVNNMHTAYVNQKQAESVENSDCAVILLRRNAYPVNVLNLDSGVTRPAAGAI